MVIDSINLLYKATLVYLEDPTNEMNLSIFNEEYNINYQRLAARINRDKWSIEKALG